MTNNNFLLPLVLLLFSLAPCWLSAASASSDDVRSCTNLSPESEKKCRRFLRIRKINRDIQDIQSNKIIKRHEQVNGIDLTVFSPEIPGGEAHDRIPPSSRIYHNGNREIAILHLRFPVGRSDMVPGINKQGYTDQSSRVLSQTYQHLFNKLFQKSQHTELHGISRIKIVGHADLIGEKEGSNFDFSEHCKNHTPPLDNSTNECLAYVRAMRVLLGMQNYLLHLGALSKWGEKNILAWIKDHILAADYDLDFFMSNTNRELGGSLWRALNVKQEIDQLKQLLKIQDKYDVREVRLRQDIRRAIRTGDVLKSTPSVKLPVNYNEKLTPFRSVVVIVEYD